MELLCYGGDGGDDNYYGGGYDYVYNDDDDDYDIDLNQFDYALGELKGVNGKV